VGENHGKEKEQISSRKGGLGASFNTGEPIGLQQRNWEKRKDIDPLLGKKGKLLRKICSGGGEKKGHPSEGTNLGLEERRKSVASRKGFSTNTNLWRGGKPPEPINVTFPMISSHGGPSGDPGLDGGRKVNSFSLELFK